MCEHVACADSRTPPLEFERGATPCWADGHYCLPAFHILGVYQAAVRDLYTRIAQHPGVAKHAAVSPSFYSEAHPWKHYMSAMAPAAAQAHAHALRMAAGTPGWKPPDTSLCLHPPLPEWAGSSGCARAHLPQAPYFPFARDGSNDSI
eukprot:6205478-Pleurochrysis_carterae.AAC.4